MLIEIAGYTLLHDVLWVHGDFSCVLKAGEKCEYFKHSDTYIFEHRGGYAPYYSADVCANNPEWFQASESDVQVDANPDDVPVAAFVEARIKARAAKRDQPTVNSFQFGL